MTEMKPWQPEDTLFTQDEARLYLRVSLKTVQIWRRAGKLKFVKLGHRTIRIRQSELERLLRSMQPSEVNTGEMNGEGRNTSEGQPR